MTQPTSGAPAPLPDDRRPAGERASAVEEHCRRCGKRIAPEVDGDHFAEAGLCFWCACIDSQG